MKQAFKDEKGVLTAKVSFDETDIQKAQNKAVIHLAGQVTVPGFRKGKAPVSTAAKYLHGNDVADETINQLLRLVDSTFEKDETFSKYVKENKLVGGFRPAVSLDKFESKDAEFTISYVLRPVVSKLGSYKGLKADKVKKEEVKAEDIEKTISKLAEDQAELVPAEKAAVKGDTANIDFCGLMDGKEFEGGSAKAFDLELGSNKFVPGFEDQVVGHKAGEKFDVKLTMPETYPAPLTGKDVTFVVTLNSVKVKQVPAINDEFATTLTGEYASKSLAELKDKVKANLTKANETKYNNALINTLLLQVRDGSEFAVADKYLDSLAQERSAEDEKNVQKQGLSLDDYLKLVGQDKKTYEAQLKDGVLGELKSSLIYDALAEAEKIAAPTEADIEKELHSSVKDFVASFTSYLKAQKMSDDQIKNQVNGYLNQVFASLLTRKVQDRVLELNGFKKPEEKPAEKADKAPASDAEKAK